MSINPSKEKSGPQPLRLCGSGVVTSHRRCAYAANATIRPLCLVIKEGRFNNLRVIECVKQVVGYFAYTSSPVPNSSPLSHLTFGATSARGVQLLEQLFIVQHVTKLLLIRTSRHALKHPVTGGPRGGGGWNIEPYRHRGKARSAQWRRKGSSRAGIFYTE